ncbi:hypothetical protein MPSEU_001077300 [Mayamaea pseudoterrestris]|nr:hypothetical protein MPSEU_001077300 [Mayamaea pseudoterrestris]
MSVPPPLFSASHGSDAAPKSSMMGSKSTTAQLNLDDIFGDVVFTPDGDTVFLSEQKDDDDEDGLLNSGEGPTFATMASKPSSDGQFVPVQQGGGLYTTNLYDNSKAALTMGRAEDAGQATELVPFKHAPQAAHHLQYAAPKKKKSSSRGDRKMSEQQKSERRERNREHAKRSRIRKKFLLESLQQSVTLLKEENEKLKQAIRQHLGESKADELLSKKESQSDVDGLLASSQGIANKVLDDPDFSFIKALQTAQQNFVVTDPSLPDNPIVYASQGFLNLTGYSLDQILGRNCRFLQGPETDPKAVERIRKAIEQGNDMSVCLLNYRVDGTTFWNQFFIAALRDANGNVTNFVGVQCKVSDQYAATVTKQQEEEELAALADAE